MLTGFDCLRPSITSYARDRGGCWSHLVPGKRSAECGFTVLHVSAWLAKRPQPVDLHLVYLTRIECMAGIIVLDSYSMKKGAETYSLSR